MAKKRVLDADYTNITNNNEALGKLKRIHEQISCIFLWFNSKASDINRRKRNTAATTLGVRKPLSFEKLCEV